MQAHTITGSAQPRLARGVRLQTDSKTDKSVLLFPEGVLELNETAQEILTVQETLADLQRRKLIQFT